MLLVLSGPEIGPVLLKLDHHLGDLDEIAVGLNVGVLVDNLADAVQVDVVAVIVNLLLVGDDEHLGVLG